VPILSEKAVVRETGELHPLGGAADKALLTVGVWLREQGYEFITPTPATHARVNARASSTTAKLLQDVFGWSRPFSASFLPSTIADQLHAASALVADGDRLHCKVRFSTLSGLLFVHSSYPTSDHDAVFFGPDTYRFARLIEQTLKRAGPADLRGYLVDIGCGSGAGGIVASRRRGGGQPLMLSDISDKALHFSWVNCALAGVAGAQFRKSDVLKAVGEPVSTIVANPPYLLDSAARLYRDGGGEWGTQLSTRILVEGLEKLLPGGQIILYTGVPIVKGLDLFRKSVESALRSHAAEISYEEIDPDVFGEELESDVYASVDRIAVVGLVVTKGTG